MKFLRLLSIVGLLLVAAGLHAQCVPGPAYHCVTIAPDAFVYVPNELTVNEGDSVEFSASSFHPLRQVLRAFPSTTALLGGLACGEEPCVKLMDASVRDADNLPAFHFICTNHIQQVMRGDITIIPRLIFAGGFEPP